MLEKMKRWSSARKSRYLAYLMIALYCIACQVLIWHGREPNNVLTGAWTTFWGGSVATGALVSRNRVKKMAEMPTIEEEDDE